MRQFLSFLFCNVCLIGWVQGVDRYRAAVYGHNVTFPVDRTRVVTRSQALEVMKTNIDVYKKQALIAANSSAKIIVYPEYGLYGVGWTRATIAPYLEYIPPVGNTTWNPCTDQTNKSLGDIDVQQSLSCMAKTANIYVVANMGASQACQPTDPSCPSDGHYQHSATVVYAPNGDFIARYFKYNLYAEEHQWDKPEKADITTFQTPFGRFGVMTSNDIMFHDPVIQLVKDMNITNIVNPTAWKNNLPLYSAVEFHSAFAEAMLINLLSANLQLPDMGYYGSGLYWPVATSINAAYSNKVDPKNGGTLVVETMTPYVVGGDSTKSRDRTYDIISKYTHDQSITSHVTINNDTYNAVLLHNSYGSPNVCHNTLCCSAVYEGEIANEMYAFAAFDGMHTNGESYYLQACVFIKCAGHTPETCGMPVTTSKSYMSKMSFVGNFSSPYVFPEVLTDQDGKMGLVPRIWLYQNAILIDAGLNGGPLSISMISRDYPRDP